VKSGKDDKQIEGGSRIRKNMKKIRWGGGGGALTKSTKSYREGAHNVGELKMKKRERSGSREVWGTVVIGVRLN